MLVLVRIVGRALIRQAGRRRLMPGRREVGGPSGSARPHDLNSRLISVRLKTPTCGPHHHACGSWQPRVAAVVGALTSTPSAVWFTLGAQTEDASQNGCCGLAGRGPAVSAAPPEFGSGLSLGN